MTARLEERLSELERRAAQLRLVADLAPAHIAHCSRDGLFLFANQSYAGRFGLTPDDITGRHVADVLGRRAWEIIQPYVDRVLNGEQVEFETEVPLQHIGPRMVHCRYAPDQDETGEVVGWVAVVQDVTERKRREAALRESEERFTRFMRHLPGLAWIKDLDGRYVYANDAALTAFATPRIELYGRTDAEVFPPETATAFRRNDAEALAHENGLQVIETLAQKDGVVHYSLVHKFPILGPDGRAMQVGGVAIDITDHLRVEEEVRRHKERLELAQEAGRIGTFEWDVRTDEVEWSAVEEELFGLPVGGFNGRFDGWLTAVHPDDRASALADINKAVADCGELRTEFRIVRPDGEVRWIAARGRVIRDGDGRAQRMVGVNLDVTERKEREAALGEADRRKDEFLATLAHELRNPLAPISNALQLVRCAGEDVAIRDQATAMMERQVAQMVRLIDDLLDLSRITRNKLELRKEWVEFAVAVQDAVETARPMIESFGHTLVLNVPKEPILLFADLARLSQIFSNLLTNAAKYTDHGGRIELNAGRDGSELVVRVQDSGIGIPAHELPRVFEMFMQVDRSLEKSHGGLGIGLTLVKNLVELHGGRVEAHSEGAGRGAVFTVRLPILVGATEQRQSAPTSGRSADRLVGRILIADDNQDSVESLAMLLRLRGADVRVASDGAAALEVAEAFRPDLMLLDIGMPKLNGYDVASRLRNTAWGKDVVLVAMTGWGQPEDRRRALEAGFDHHLTKPIDFAAFETVAAKLKR